MNCVPARAVQRRPDPLLLGEGDAADGGVVALRERGPARRVVVPLELPPLTEAPRALVLIRLGGNSTDFRNGPKNGPKMAPK